MDRRHTASPALRPPAPLGLKIGSVRVVPYDDRWPAEFALEQARLKGVLGRSAAAIEHVGSTAVPRLKSKPIIDIAVGVRSLKPLPTWIRKLRALDYVYFGDTTQRGDHFFAKTRKEVETIYLHFVIHGSAGWRDYLEFRDRLRASPRLARRYGNLKEELAAEFPDKRRYYTFRKSDFILDLSDRPQQITSNQVTPPRQSKRNEGGRRGAGFPHQQLQQVRR